MAEQDWQPAPEEPKQAEPQHTEQKHTEPKQAEPAEPVVDKEPPKRSEAMDGFIRETSELWEKMKQGVEAEKKPEPPPAKIAEPSTPKEDTHFIPDLDKATPEQIKARLDYLYGKTKEQDRQWAEAQTFLRKQREETEKLRAEAAKRDIARSESELDALQLEVVNLLTPGSPNYNPALGAQKLRELSGRDVQIKEDKDEEKRRAEEFTKSLESDENQQNATQTVEILNDFAGRHAYAQEGHPLYPHVVSWLQRAYHEAPPDVTVAQIVERAEKIFDDYVRRSAPPPAYQGGNGQDRGAPASRAPGAGGERLTVSQVIGTPQRGAQTPSSPADRLSSREQEVAVKLFPNESRERAYALYAEGKG